MAGVTQNDTYDKIPDDAFGEECSPNAKLWRVYMNEAQILDSAMTKELGENADVLLVFSGLFSAVVSAFVAMTSQSLQMDYAPVTAELVFEMVQLQRAALDGSDSASVQPSSWTPTTSFSPSSTDVWVNGLWFTSLTVSLIAALIAVLAKQWVSYYVSKPPGSGTVLDQVRIRQFRYTNFQKWSIPVIIGLLPFLLHIALVIFLVGLVVFLSALVISLASTIGTLTVLTVLAYAATVVFSTIDPSCPYRTPLSTILYSVSHQFFPDNNPSESTLSAMEQRTIEKGIDSLDAGAILWLLRTSSNATVRALVIEAMGNIRPKIIPALTSALVSEDAVWDQYHTLLKDSLIHDNINNRQQPKASSVIRVDRLLQVLRRLAPPRIITSEAPLTSRLVPDGFSWNDYKALSMSIIFLLEMRDTEGKTYPMDWPSPTRIVSRVIQDECKLPRHFWQDLFAHIDLAALCALRGAHNPDAESFCDAYLTSHHMWCESNDGLPQSARAIAIEQTRAITFREMLPHFQEQIDKAILAQFPPSNTHHGASIHAQVVTSVLDHLLSSGLERRLIEASCQPCGMLCVSALNDIQILLAMSSLSLEDSAAYKDVIQRFLSSNLFDRPGHQKDSMLWEGRSRALLAFYSMKPDSHRAHDHRWPLSEDVVNALIRLGLHVNSVDSPMSPDRLSSQIPLSRMIGDYWYHSDVDTTYYTFLDVDAFVFLDHTKYLFPHNLDILDAYVHGLLRAKDNGELIDRYTEYLFRPENLCTALSIVAGQFAAIEVASEVVKSILIRIVKLCPFTDPQEAQSRWNTVLNDLEAFSNQPNNTVTDPQEAQSLWFTVLDDLEAFSNQPNNTGHQYQRTNKDGTETVSYKPAQIAQIKSRVTVWRNFLTGYLERLRSNTLEPGDEVDFPLRWSQQVN